MVPPQGHLHAPRELVVPDPEPQDEGEVSVYGLWSIIYKQTNVRTTRAEEDVQETEAE